ncbi:probable inactive histone-lysine N-methyltransferase SUVR2 isoform X2 [Magnolia sinica]|uniref:probable inactive histone-lysine N-methyltransferase SUVR2 isoform X2 n=1 Tax=Magnolia sinica TaxID=86752 RepID=UPI002659A4D7|nr:probable inactive histone-lysine N-methyltransferase SUVR2 isoform X2 [Magnolia sinica]
MVPPRVVLAMQAMKAIGIPPQRVKPVLKNLLKVYDNNWELIEEEHYRVLADAIFDFQEEEARKKKVENFDSVEDQNEEARINGASETPMTRPRLRQEDDQPSHSRFNSGGESSSKRRKLDETISPETSLGRENTDPVPPQAQTFVGERRMEPTSTQAHDIEKRLEPVSPQTHLSEKRTEPVLPQIAPREKRLVSERMSNNNCFKEPKIEPVTDILPKDVPSHHHCNTLIKHRSEPFTSNSPQFEAPIAVIHPPTLASARKKVNKVGSSIESDSTERTDSVETLASRHVNRVDGKKDVPEVTCKNRTSPDPGSIQETSENIEIASSTSGEVKLSLTCDSALDRSNFHIPNLDAVLKMVEDHCLKSYKFVEPTFSVVKLMKELCQCFVELGTDSNDGEMERDVNINPALDLLRKSNLKNPIRSNFDLPASSSNGSADFCHSSGVVVPQVPKTPTLNGMDGLFLCTQPNEKVSVSSNSDRHKKKELKGSEPKKANSYSLDIVPSCRLSIDDVRPLHDINDISKGEESVRISSLNEVSSEIYPPSFYYIPQNIVYQNAYLNFSLARIGDENCCSDCFGDCLSSSIPCACARETGGEYAYTLDGRVKKEFLDECMFMIRDPQKHHFFYCKECPLERSKNEVQPDPCKGHLVKKFIKECWSKCGCNKQCGNRVVQRGITCNLQVFLTSEGKGWGLRTLDELPRGTFVCEYVGEVLTNMELYDRTMQITGNEKHTYPVLLDADWGSEGVLKDEDALCLDATFYGNVARFINHRCIDANLVGIPVEVETPDHHYYHLAFFTTRKVEELEELTWDYGIDFDDHDHPVKAFRCCCGSKFCRDMKRSSRTKQRALILR